MTHEQKRAIVDYLFARLTAELAAAGCREPQISVELRDTDLSPLQPVIGDHLSVSVAAIIRLSDTPASYKAPLDPLPIGKILVRNDE